MEKRTFPRQEVELEAIFSFDDGEGYICNITDYSQSGIYLTFKSARQLVKLSESLRELETIATVTFKIDKRYVSIETVFIHQKGHGLGVKYLHQHPKHKQSITDALEAQKDAQIAGKKQDIDSKTTQEVTRKFNLAKSMNGRIERFLEERLPGCFNTIVHRLVKDADLQKSDAAQHPYFDAIAAFNKQVTQIQENYIAKIASDALDVSSGRYKESKLSTRNQSDQKYLSLVDKHEFEDWLIVQVTTSRADLMHRQALIELQLRLDVLFGKGKGDASRVFNPYSPGALCHTFYDFIRHLKLSNKIEKLVFKVFQETILNNLDTLYDEINRVLIDADILPKIDINKYMASETIKQNLASANDDVTAAPSSASSKSVEGTSITKIGDVREQVERIKPQLHTLQEQEEPKAIESKAMKASAAPVTESYLKLQKGLERARKAYSTATNIWRTHHHVSSDSGSVRESKDEGLSIEIVDKLIDSLKHVKSEVVDGHLNLSEKGALKKYISEQYGDQLGINEDQLEEADIIENLVTNVLEDSRIDEQLKVDFRKLELPLFERLLGDPDLFTAEYHPLRQAVNYLALLSDKDSANLHTNKTAIQQHIADVVEYGGTNEQEIDRVLQDLESLVTKEKQLIARNLSRVTEVCEGQQKIITANQFIESELLRRFKDVPVPRVIIDIIKNGWKELMRLCYFREGLESRAWQMTAIVLDQLILRLVPDRYDESKILFKKEELVKLIKKGLAKISSTHTVDEKIIEGLTVLLNQDTVDDSDFVLYEPETMINTPLASVMVQEESTELDDKSITRWLKRAKDLTKGQWLEFGVISDRSQLNQLAWVSEQKSRFVFVNHHGMKVLDLQLNELANRLKSGDIVVMSDAGLPAIEKGLDALVQNVYEKLAYESTHDQLTGLSTRKEFEHCIAQSVARSKKNTRRYALIYIDLLQFKVINNTSGYQAGDRILKQIAIRIKAPLEEPDVMVGRIGGNEFAILTPIETDQKAYMLATEIKHVIESERFIVDKQTYVISAVVSLVSFDQSNDQILELLRSVESAAEIGKKTGEKDIQVVHPGDKRIEERDEIMSWVSRINQALDQEQLKVRCQLIAPIRGEGESLPHFEVLLTVVDQNGEHLPPADFIQAAEEYSRMGSVDRWVIENILRWMIDNEKIVKKVGGFSINLSGHSLNDETFLDFIFEKFVRYPVSRKKLIFEITETTAVANLENAADFINEMRGIGCRFSLDDFGAGQSSYAYLKQLPVDFIKIDGAFVKNITEDDVDYALVKSITDMGHFLNKKIVAEYVSSEEILEVVKDIGVDYVQGFHLGKPVLIEQLESFLSSGSAAVQ